MPVVVTGASGFIGRHAASAFLRASPQVRAYVRRAQAAPSIREAGAKVAVGRIDDVDNLRDVMSGAHTVCHLVGGLYLPDKAAYEEVNLRSVETVLLASARAEVTRFLYLSYPGASPAATNAFLRAKGMAEDAVRASGLEYMILRATHVYGRESRWLEVARQHARRSPPIVVGSGTQRVAPVSVADVSAVLAAADDRRTEVAGTWGLEGPDTLTADELADLLAERHRRKLHLSPALLERAGRLLGPPISTTALEVMAGDSLSDAPDAREEFGVPPTPLLEGLAGARSQ